MNPIQDLIEKAKAVEQACYESYHLSDRESQPTEDDECDLMMRPLWESLRAAIPAAEEWVKGDESKYAKFGRLVVENIRNQSHWWQDEWSIEIMPLAVDAGLAEYVPYDPEVHGPCVEAEPGEDIWFWSPAPPQEVK